ncbi:unnamed protein product [Rotaria sordida]|uniref:F-box domain-containing protein n=1 Tax=Rotaria sordida TaxID=392033 RepID=A0A815HH03_9BILA|nr:unnamed protein product [Rotaria sordida]CAF1350658.1 unnamed protein product [Rotaria sordida]
MNERKRQRNSSTDSCFTKKLQCTSCLVTSINTDNSIFQFEDLSNDIIYEIFDYLDTYHIYECFFNLNKRFHNILLDSILPIHVNIPLRSKLNFDRYYTDFIQPNKHRIQSLYLLDPFAIDFFSSLVEHISKCFQLQTLVLNEIDSKIIESLLTDLSSLNNLSSLSIRIGCDSNKITIYNLIFYLPVLKYCKISFEEDVRLGSLPLCMNPLSSIEHFIINDNYNLDEVEVILSYIPHVRHLSIEYQNKPDPKSTKIFLMVLDSLTHICVTGDRLELDSIEQFVKNHANQIKVVHISSFGLQSDYAPWVKTISSYLSHVRVVDFPGEDMNHCRRVLQIYESIYNPRYNSFPYVRQWFFTHEPMPDAYLHEIFCSVRTHK